MIHFRTFAIAIACAVISLGGCGGGSGNNGPPPLFTTQISSDPAVDGDIEQTSISPPAYSITQGMSPSVQSVYAGIFPATLTEIRAFLDFPLTGAGGIPSNAIIDSAFVDIYINSLQPSTGSIPLRIDLITFQPLTLIGTDFDRVAQPPLASITVSPPFTLADVGTNVSLDVTSLMKQAQQLQLNEFQLRILEDLGPAIPVVVEINDSTGPDRATHAPQLTVSYF